MKKAAVTSQSDLVTKAVKDKNRAAPYKKPERGGREYSVDQRIKLKSIVSNVLELALAR